MDKHRKVVTAAWLAQLGERRSAEREVAGSNHDICKWLDFLV